MSGKHHEHVHFTGGYVPGEGMALIHPDECIVRGESIRAGRLDCSRPGHPTATSACAAQR